MNHSADACKRTCIRVLSQEGFLKAQFQLTGRAVKEASFCPRHPHGLTVQTFLGCILLGEKKEKRLAKIVVSPRELQRSNVDKVAASKVRRTKTPTRQDKTTSAHLCKIPSKVAKSELGQ